MPTRDRVLAVPGLEGGGPWCGGPPEIPDVGRRVQTLHMIVVRGTKKFLDRVGVPGPSCASSASLGDWYANALLWRPQVALFVNASTLLPVVVRLAPANSVVSRLPEAFRDIAQRLGVEQASLDCELEETAEHALAKTASRCVLGVMTEFAHMADHYRSEPRILDLADLSLWLARVPCSPLFRSYISPDRALLAALA